MPGHFERGDPVGECVPNPIKKGLMKLSNTLSAEDKRAVDNGKIIGGALTILGLIGILFFSLRGLSFFSLIGMMIAETFPVRAASESNLFLLSRLSIAILIVGVALLCLAAYVESSLQAQARDEAEGGPAGAGPSVPGAQLKTNRGLLKFILLSLITFDIYGLVVMSGISNDINIIATRYDGKKTMNFLLIFFIFSWLTLGIAPLVWAHRLCRRIGGELKRRGIPYAFDAGTFWIWNILGSLIVVGPFVFLHKLFHAMNQLSQHYNTNG